MFSFCANTSVSVIACNITEVRYVLIFKSNDALKNTKCLSSESMRYNRGQESTTRRLKLKPGLNDCNPVNGHNRQ